MYFKVHACVAAYMNNMRRNLSTTCITSQTAALNHQHTAQQASNRSRN